MASALCCSPVRKYSPESLRSISTALAATVILLPLAVVLLIPTDTVEPYVFRARLTIMLAQSDSGKLRYFQADTLEGSAPASAVVLALDQAYSRGYDPESTAPGLTVWLQGSLMTPDVFYGEQYLFFDRPQVYVRQVKSGLLWPDQWTELRVLYLSPLETLAAPVQIPFLVRSDSLTYRVLAVLLMRSVVVVSTIFLLAQKKFRHGRVSALVLGYALLAMLLTVPILGHLY